MDLISRGCLNATHQESPQFLVCQFVQESSAVVKVHIRQSEFGCLKTQTRPLCLTPRFLDWVFDLDCRGGDGRTIVSVVRIVNLIKVRTGFSGHGVFLEIKSEGRWARQPKMVGIR